MALDLTALGWNERMAEAFAVYAAEGFVPARVALEHTHIYRVFAESGEWLARVSGRLRHDAETRSDFPAVGDWVAIELPAEGNEPSSISGSPRASSRGDARIRAVLPRFTRFSRRAAGDATVEQIVAANIDVVFLVTGLDGNFNPRRIERYLVVAFESGATPVIVLNKADLVDDVSAIVEDVRARAVGVEVHAISCRIPGSVDVLRPYLGHGQTGALLGSSGVGKSSIVNQLVGYDLMTTREARDWDSRGRHMSTARQLVLLPGHGVLIDTPGMRELQLWETGDAIADTFSDIDALGEKCRFRDCQHRTEPECAVRAAVESGDLDALRLQSFHKLAAEQDYQARQQDQRAQLDVKRRDRIGSKAARKVYKDKGKS